MTAITSFNIKPGPMGWGWVRIEEVCSLLQSSPENLWRDWLFHEGDTPLWSPERGIIQDVYYREFGGHWSDGLFIGKSDSSQDRFNPAGMFIPAGWALDIERAYREGVVRILLLGEGIVAGLTSDGKRIYFDEE